MIEIKHFYHHSLFPYLWLNKGVVVKLILIRKS